MCTISDYDHFEMTSQCRAFVDTELDMWHKWYLPIRGVKGKIVVDLGAGCGETAFFYLKHGASRVIAVEKNRDCLDRLRKNFGEDSRVDIIDAYVGHVKVDIDGEEAGMVFETHAPTSVNRVWQDGHSDTYLWKVND